MSELDTSPERIALVRDMLKSFYALERKNTDELGWIALKFSCTVREAKKLLALANNTPHGYNSAPQAPTPEQGKGGPTPGPWRVNTGSFTGPTTIATRGATVGEAVRHSDWERNGGQLPARTSISIGGPNMTTVAICPNEDSVNGYANAEFIVQACALHAELVGALEALSAAVAPTREGKRDGVTFGRLSAADAHARDVLARVKP